eukprot:11312-Heterococcus_DN1.PRE.2
MLLCVCELCAVSDSQLNSALSCLCVLLLPLAGNPTAAPTTAKPTTAAPTTAKPTTAAPTTAKPWWTAAPSTAKPTSQADGKNNHSCRNLASQPLARPLLVAHMSLLLRVLHAVQRYCCIYVYVCTSSVL